MTEIDHGFFTIEVAWWKWVDENCPSKSPGARGKWMRENTLTFQGVVWRRESTAFRSTPARLLWIAAHFLPQKMAARSDAVRARLTAGTMPTAIGDWDGSKISYCKLGHSKENPLA